MRKQNAKGRAGDKCRSKKAECRSEPPQQLPSAATAAFCFGSLVLYFCILTSTF